MRDLSRVVQRSPGIMGGTSVFAGTRVPVRTMLDYLEAGDRLDDFLDQFPTVSRDQTVAFLELATEAALAKTDPPCGRAVATAADDGTVRVWDVATSRPIGPVLRHEAGMGMVAFTNDGLIRTGSLTGTVKLWDAARAPIEGNVERIRLWIQAMTGFELNAEGSLRALEGPRWRHRRARLRELGGPPANQAQ